MSPLYCLSSYFLIGIPFEGKTTTLKFWFKNWKKKHYHDFFLLRNAHCPSKRQELFLELQTGIKINLVYSSMFKGKLILKCLICVIVSTKKPRNKGFLPCPLKKGLRDHPFKTSANFHDFWPLPPTIGIPAKNPKSH